MKIFSKKIFYAPLLLLIFSFFFIPKSIFADTYTFTPDSTSLGLVNSANFEAVHQKIIDTMQSENYSYYILYWENTGIEYVYRVSFFNSISSVSVDISSNYHYISATIRGTRYTYTISNDGSTITYNNSFSNQYPYIDLSNYTFNFTAFLDSNIDIPNTSNDTYIITYNDISEEVLPNDNFKALYQILHSIPPTPPDNTPLLTEFFDICIEKLILICDFITSSYIYLSIFTIFIFYFVILLFRRLK